MLNFKKVLNSKIISIITVISFLFNSAAFGIDINSKSSLRVPLSLNSGLMTRRFFMAAGTVAAMMRRAEAATSSLTHSSLLFEILDSLHKDKGRIWFTFDELQRHIDPSFSECRIIIFGVNHAVDEASEQALAAAFMNSDDGGVLIEESRGITSTIEVSTKGTRVMRAETKGLFTNGRNAPSSYAVKQFRDGSNDPTPEIKEALKHIRNNELLFIYVGNNHASAVLKDMYRKFADNPMGLYPAILRTAKEVFAKERRRSVVLSLISMQSLLYSIQSRFLHEILDDSPEVKVLLGRIQEFEKLWPGRISKYPDVKQRYFVLYSGDDDTYIGIQPAKDRSFSIIDVFKLAIQAPEIASLINGGLINSVGVTLEQFEFDGIKFSTVLFRLKNNPAQSIIKRFNPQGRDYDHIYFPKATNLKDWDYANLPEEPFKSICERLKPRNKTIPIFFVGSEILGKFQEFKTALKLVYVNSDYYPVVLAETDGEMVKIREKITSELGVSLEGLQLGLIKLGDISISRDDIARYSLIFNSRDVGLRCIPFTPYHIDLHPELKQVNTAAVFGNRNIASVFAQTVLLNSCL
ncbi:MAG: hypothetical protein Q8N76_04600 [Candidatus Omnitrophota bacterium]|nr:hypothetical protein [Candidatus Omnitrophota bacterium]